MERQTEVSTERRMLTQLRGQLDELDDELARLIQRRGELVREVHDLKAAHDVAVRDWAREQEIMRRIEQVAGPYPRECLRQIWTTLMFWAPATRVDAE